MIGPNKRPEDDFFVIPSVDKLEAEEKKELDAEIQRLAKEPLSTSRPRKRTAAYAGAWTVLSSIGGAGSSLGRTVSDTALWSLGYETTPTVDSLEKEPREYHEGNVAQGMGMINDFVTGVPLAPEVLDERIVTDLDLETNIVDVNIYLHNILIAVNRIADEKGIELSEEARDQLATELRDVYGSVTNNPKASDEGIRSIKNTVLEFLSEKVDSIDGKDLKRQTDLIRGENTPRTLVKSYTFGERKVEERLVALDTETEIGTEYLESVDLSDDTRNLETRSGIRVSEAKNYPEMAGKTVNLWRQSVREGETEKAVVFRSGVFSVHSHKSSSIRALDKALTKIAEMEDGVEKEAAIESLRLPKGVERSQASVEAALKRRRHLGIAQALPKIIASLQESIQDPRALENALTTGRFLHAETSYLSDFDDERRMLHDMEFVMGELNKHVKITFMDDMDPGVHSIYANETTHDITITLPLPEGAPDALKDHTFGLQALMFSQGVNFKQALSTFVNVSEQSAMNEKALIELRQYALSVFNSSEGERKDALREPLLRFLQHFTQGTENMPAVDLEGTDLIADLIYALGGQMGIVCKSGKDRTGMAASRFMANKLAQDGVGDKNEIKPILDQGLSYALTAYNSGGVKGYAIAGSGHTAVDSMVSNFAPDYSLVNKNAKT